MIHANTTGDGYWTDISRTYVVGAPNEQQECMTAAIAEARTAALNAVVPGVEARQVDTAARNVLTRYGYGDALKHSTGHGVGFAAADPNAHPRIHPASKDVLREGMTFNIEPAIYIEGIGGMRHCDVVACTSSGAKVLTDF
jgi:Xaa-Pro dipeptidase